MALSFKSRKKVINLRIKDLAELLGKTRGEIEEMLMEQDVVELNLSERKSKHSEDDDLKISEHV